VTFEPGQGRRAARGKRQACLIRLHTVPPATLPRLSSPRVPR
jgi:hypothetical protein